MFNVRKGVTLNDFSNETKAFLVKAGFTDADDISEMFTDYLKENGLDLNRNYAGATKTNFNFESFKCNHEIYCAKNESHLRYIKLEKFDTVSKDWQSIEINTAKNNTYFGITFGGAC